MTSPRITKARALFPVLEEIDDCTLSRLDRSEWHMPTRAQADDLRSVGERLGVHLMTYRAGADVTQGRGLCSLVAAAQLDACEISEIDHVQATYPGTVIVAYERPARLLGANL
jgi:hypothetical protein